MASCLLCSTTVGPGDVVCPHCGGAVDDTGDDPTTVAPSPGGTWIAPPPVPGDPAAPTGWEPPGQQAPAAPPGWEPSAPGPFAATGPATGPFGPAAAPYGAAPGGAPPPGPAPYGAPGGYPYGAPVYLPYQPKQPTEGLAIASFVTSLVGLVLAGSCLFPILACPIGAVMGQVAMRRIDQNGNQGRGLALAGAIIGWIGTALLIAGAILFGALVATDGWA